MLGIKCEETESVSISSGNGSNEEAASVSISSGTGCNEEGAILETEGVDQIADKETDYEIVNMATFEKSENKDVSHKWCVDSRATKHMTNNEHPFCLM